MFLPLISNINPWTYVDNKMLNERERMENKSAIEWVDKQFVTLPATWQLQPPNPSLQ
jgi:hypothetical protein